MDIKIRSDEKLYMNELKSWLHEESETPLEEMGSFFEKRVGGYEEHMSVWKEAYRKMALLVPESTENILDLGCGTGLELDEIFKVQPGVCVTGIDLCPAMLKKLKEKHGDKKINIICGDYFTVDLGKGLYDLAISFESLHHFTLNQKKELYKKIYDALKNDGIFIECDYIACCEEEEEILYSEYLRKREKIYGTEKGFVHFDIPLTAEHEIEALSFAGFKSVDIIDSINGATFIRAVK